ncbi:MAG: hypothetical protein J6V82_03140, partial [Clostridia bacterium]|nr:hypothetical protein [Clostridia bacterium]
MKENCIKVFTDTEGLYEPNTPVVVGEKKLFKDTESGNTLAQLKLQNVSGKTISSFKLRVTPFDSQRVQLGSATVYEYANLTLADNEECGAKDLFLFHHPDTRFLRVE